MNRIVILATLFALSLNHGHCETLSFEVASVTPCKPGTPEPPEYHMGIAQFVYPGGRFNASATTIRYMIDWAYGILPAQDTGGPSWLDSQRYDIAAKAEGNATDRQIKLMLQALLADRFKLKFHTEMKEEPVIMVSLGKSEPKLTPAKDGEVHTLKVVPRMNPDGKPISFHVVATRYTLEQLNETFSRHLGRIIQDQTGLKGEFDFELDLTPDEDRPNPLDPAIVIGAMRDQLGLTVKSQKAPAEILVIDSAQPVSAGN